MNDRISPLLVIPLAAVVVIIGGTRFFAQGAEPPAGVGEPGITPCETTGNCVSSLSSDAANQVDPLACALPAAEVTLRLVAALDAIARTVPVTVTDTYIHAESTSLVFGFIDDVELVPDVAAGVVHVRSSSRVGSSDLGKNTERIADLRAALDCG